MLPKIIALDYETVDSRGASFEYFRKDFKLLSLSLTWRNEQGELESWFDTRPSEMYEKLKWLSDTQIPVVVHNFQFEYGVTHTLYPDLNINWHLDTMRLAKLRDGGGDEFNVPMLTQEQEIDIALGEYTEKDVRKSWAKSLGNSLEACARRFLGEQNHDHKKAAHDYLRDVHGITRNHGGNLHLLPYRILRDYNIADTETTLLIYENSIQYFSDIGFKLKQDTQLYNMRVKHVAEAHVRGLRIDRDALLKYILEIEAEVADIERQFKKMFKEELRKVRKWLYLEKRLEMLALSADRYKQKRWEKYMSNPAEITTFNFNSSARHLPMLFMGQLKIKPTFRTAKGAPSFKASHLSQWGEGGKVLIKRKKRLLVLQQAVAIYIASAYDGLLHQAVKASGTRTNRVSSGR